MPAAPVHRCAKCQSRSFTATNLLGNALDPGLPGMIVVAAFLASAFWPRKARYLSAQAFPGIVYALIAVFVASTVSSIAGFAFSALCGALLFHLMDSPVYACT